MNGSPDVKQEYSPSYRATPLATSAAEGPAVAPGAWRKQVYLEDPRRKSVPLAVVMSLMPGLGQVYVGYYQQGFINILVAGTLIAALDNAHFGVLHTLEPVMGLFLAFFWLYNLVDAGRRASFYNQSLVGLGPVALPETMKLPRGGGSLAGGVALVLVGLLLVANTAFGMPLDWLERWWPMALVLVGVYLVVEAVRAKQRDERRPQAEAQAPTDVGAAQ
jgi:hypothetical protein